MSSSSQRVVDCNLVAIYPACSNGFKTCKVIVGLLFNLKYAYFTWAPPDGPAGGRRVARGCGRHRAVQARGGAYVARHGVGSRAVCLSTTNMRTHMPGVLESG